jgi:hypothetical protein
MKKVIISGKTYILGTALLLKGLVAWASGDVGLMEMIKTTGPEGQPLYEMLGGGLVMTLRHAIAKIGIKI